MKGVKSFFQKHWLIMVIVVAFLVPWLLEGCTTVDTNMPKPAPQELKITVESATDSKVAVEDLDKPETVKKVMSVPNPEIEFSVFSKYDEKTKSVYVSLTEISRYQARDLWFDFKKIEMLKPDKVVLFMCNPGGDAFNGFSLSDQINALQKSGIHFYAEAYGILASAAIPVFLTSEKRAASINTIFLIHPATLFKFFSAETLKDIESQKVMLEMMREKYANIVSSNSILTTDEVKAMMEKDSWFTAQQAKEWKMIDEIR